MNSLSCKIPAIISLRKLKSRAIKEGINPAVVNPGVSVIVNRAKMDNGQTKCMALNIDYANPVDAIDAFKHSMGYEALVQDMWGSAVNGRVNVKMNSLEGKFGKYDWLLRPSRGADPTEGIRLLVGVDGYCKGDSIEGVEAVWGYENSDIKYNGARVLQNPSCWLQFSLDDLDEKVIKEKVDFVKDILKPYWTFQKFKLGVETPEGAVSVKSDVYLVEKSPEDINEYSVRIPIGDFGEDVKQGIVAEYKESAGS